MGREGCYKPAATALEVVGHVGVVSFTGEWELDDGVLIREAFQPQAGVDCWVADFSDTGYNDSETLKPLLEAAQEVTERGERIVVVCPEGKQLRRILGLINVGQALSVYNKLTDGLKSFKS